MKEIECQEVHLWDGGDRHNFGFFISKAVPKAEIEKRYPHSHVSTTLIKVFDSLQEVSDNDQRKLRQSAWAKLTPAERQALGMLEKPQ